MRTLRNKYSKFTSSNSSKKSFTKTLNNSSYLPLASLSHLNHLQFNQTRHTSTDNPTLPQQSFLDTLISKHGPDTLTTSDPDSFNRWKLVPYAVTTHLCLGACYAWSIFNEPLTKEIGVLASSSADWSIATVPYTFTGIIVGQGLTMAIFGKMVDRLGARLSGLIGGTLYGGGMCLGALGVYMHSLPVLVLGYGAIAGIGMGIAYLPPVTTLLKWFPDRPGLGAAMAICGFGGGATLIAPMKKYLISQNFEAPDFIGTSQDIITKIDESGKRICELNGKWREVIDVSSSTLSKFSNNTLQEGLYLCGTGNTGVTVTMASLAAAYFSIVTLGAMSVKLPPVGWKPEFMRIKEQEEAAIKTDSTTNNNESNTQVEKLVHVDDVMKLPQFWCQFITFCATATVGMGLLSQAKDVLNVCFVSNAAAFGGPAAFALAYVQVMSTANLGGRFCWATLSDKLGPKNIFTLFTFGGMPLCFSLPYIIHSTSITESVWPVYAFFGSTFFIVSFFGGGYSTMPAYENKLYGSKYVGSIHGRLMIASALSGIVGPSIFGKLRQNSKLNSINELLEKVDPNTFNEKFGLTIENSKKLIDSGVLNIENLLSICPQGTIDPTPYLYDPAFKTMGIVFGIGGLANLLVKKVDPKWFVANRIKAGAKYSDINP